MGTRKKVKHTTLTWHAKAISYLICLFLVWGVLDSSNVSAREWYVSTSSSASDANPGTHDRPFRSVRKALSVTKPGDTDVFSAGIYPCAEEKSPDGRPGLTVTLRSAGDGKVLFSGDGSQNLLIAGSYTTITGIEFTMNADTLLKGFGVFILRKEHIDISNCRFYACDVGVKIFSSHHLTIKNCEIAFSGKYGIHMIGSGDGNNGQWDPSDENAWVEIRNCWLHDAGWNVEGSEGYGITSNGTVENLVIENCQIDNNTGDGILYEDWGIHTTARYNVIRGTGLAGIWIDNASMSIFDNNFLYGNNVAIWLSGEEDFANRYLNDLITIRNNIIVHNDWAAINPYARSGKNTILLSQATSDVYFDNNTVAYNNCSKVVGIQRHPPLIEFRNIWFRNNIFWDNTGGVGIDSGLDTAGIHFLNNLWDTPYQGDSRARSGDPAFADPNASTPEGYRLKSGSAAIDAGMLLYSNPLDFWNGQRPHLPKTGVSDNPNPEKGFYNLPKSGVYDIGAHEFGSTGMAHIGLDLATFPFEVLPYKLQFRAKPKR
jgi:Right handed beta helix region